MKILVDHAELTRESKVSTQFKQVMKKGAWKVVKSTSISLMKQVKMRMPWDTGRASGSWGKTTGNVATPADSYWLENENELWIEQGTTVHYVALLEQGSSRQAPAGFIEASALAAQQELDKYVEQMLDEVFGAVFARM